MIQRATVQLNPKFLKNAKVRMATSPSQMFRAKSCVCLAISRSANDPEGTASRRLWIALTEAFQGARLAG